MEDERKKEIKALSKKYLKIPKELRLLGEDGRIHLPAVPDKFYLEEVASWLSYAPEFYVENYNKRNCDYLMESKGYESITKINFDIGNSQPGRYPDPDLRNSKVSYLNLWAPMKVSQLSIPELSSKDLLKNSYSHHRFLFIALRKVQENHAAFFEILANKLNIPIRFDQNYFGDVLNVLRKINRQLLELEEKGHYNIIPMLYSLRDHGVIMSTDLNNVFKYEVEEWGLLYSYGFSYQTSHAVLVVLKKLFTLYIKRYETLLGKSSWDVPVNAPTTIDDRKVVVIPTATKEKMKLVREILGLKNDENDSLDDLVLNPFQVMLLLRAFQDKKFIRQKIDKYQLAIAYNILTGGSSAYFENQYPKDEINAVKLKKWSNKKQLKKAIECISELREKISSDILPHLSNWEKLSQAK